MWERDGRAACIARDSNPAQGVSGRAQAAQLCSEAQVRESELVQRPQLSCLHGHPLLHLVLPHEVRVQNAHAARKHHDLHTGRSAVRPSGRRINAAGASSPLSTDCGLHSTGRTRRGDTPTSRHRELPALQRALTSRLYSLVKCAVNSLRVMSRTCAPFAPAVRAAVRLALGPCDSIRLFGGDATAQERRNEPSDAETSSAALRRLATSRKRRTCLAHIGLFGRDTAWREDA